MGLECKKCGNEITEPFLCSACVIELLEKLKSKKKKTELECCGDRLVQMGNPKGHFCVVDVQPKKCQITVWQNNRKITYKCTPQVIEKLRNHVSVEDKQFLTCYYGVILEFVISPETNIIVDVSEFPYGFDRLESDNYE